MLNVTVHGLWGVRKEDPQELAERWGHLLRTLGGIDADACGTWRAAEAEDDPTAPPVELGVPALTEYLLRTNPDSDAPYIGYTSSLWSGQPDTVKVTVSVTAGGSANRAPDSCVVGLVSAADDAPELVRRSTAVLEALVSCWGPDWGEAYSREEFRAVKTEFGLRAGAPRAGRSVYLSPGRADRVPEGLPGTYTRTADGGLVVDLTRGGTELPGIDTITEVNRQLLAAGALEPLTVPFDRATFP
ncbi:Imm52 family immunity protein [Streptomyces sp. NPDC056352]|uniref:Imm52 family immunity protein n=1 Tax=Streptomyces sp. NPDC056352 TaxID=3345791 RepID=UPI0035DBA0FB